MAAPVQSQATAVRCCTGTSAACSSNQCATHRCVLARLNRTVILNNRMLCRTISFHQTKTGSTKTVPFGCLRASPTTLSVYGTASTDGVALPSKPASLPAAVPSQPFLVLALDARSRSGTVAAVGGGSSKSYSPFNALLLSHNQTRHVHWAEGARAHGSLIIGPANKQSTQLDPARDKTEHSTATSWPAVQSPSPSACPLPLY